jgi:hypothetical protein
MKKTIQAFGLFFLLFAMALSLAGCANIKGENKTIEKIEKSKSGDTAWIYEKSIVQPISVTSTIDRDVVLGDVEKDRSSVSIPKGSFDGQTEVKLQTPESVPEYFKETANVIGAPIEISIGKPTRLNEPATVSFKFDPSALPANATTSELRIAYFDGKGWEYIKPESIDMQNGIAAFKTYHFSLFGMNQISSKAKLTEEWIHSKTLDDQLKENLNKMSDHVANQIIDLTLEKMGVDKKLWKGKVLAEVLKNDSYKKIYDSFDKGDIVDMSQKISLLCGKKIAELVPPSAYNTTLKGVIGFKDDIAAISKAAAFASEGRYEDAARIIGEQIADKFIITTAGKIAVEIINHQIGSWKNAEIEAAYNAYKDGANGYFWGYNVDKGDFDSVWDQMRGIRRQLEIEAVAAENQVRREAGLPELTEAQMDIIRDDVKESFKRQFALRQEREADFEAAEKRLKMIMDGFDKAGFFDSAGAPVGLDKGFDYQNKLDILGHFADMIMKDTNRFEVSDKIGLIMADKISIDDIVQGARFYFSGPDGKKAYQKFLKDRFNISLFPPLKDLAGDWPGSLTITDIIVDEAFKKEQEDKKAKGEKTEEGCDFSINLEELKGKTVPITIKLIPQGEAGGNMVFKSKDSDDKNIPFKYDSGAITASISEKGGVGALHLEVAEDAQNYSANGSMNIDYAGGKVKILTSIKTGRPIKAVPPAPAPAKPALKK